MEVAGEPQLDVRETCNQLHKALRPVAMVQPGAAIFNMDLLQDLRKEGQHTHTRTHTHTHTHKRERRDGCEHWITYFIR